MFGAVAVAAQRHMPTGQHKLEFVATGLAKDGQRLVLTEPADVVLELPVEAFVPRRTGHALKDLADQILLIGRVKAALDRGLRDLPVVLHARPQQAAGLIEMVPVEAHLALLLIVERIE